MSNALAFLGRDMAVDLGTANTLVYVRGRGIVLNEPSVVALNASTGQIVAVGAGAKRMIGRTPGNIVAVRPLKDGVIADFDVTERMLRYFIQKVHRRRHLAKPRVVVAVPSGITGVEQSAVKEAGHQAGARRVYIIEEPMAAPSEPGLWVPETLSRHATWAYSWRRPPSLSRRMTLMSASTGSGSARSGLAWFSARCGRCPLKWDSYSDRTLRKCAALMMSIWSRTSRRTVPTQRSMIAFMRGV